MNLKHGMAIKNTPWNNSCTGKEALDVGEKILMPCTLRHAYACARAAEDSLHCHLENRQQCRGQFDVRCIRRPSLFNVLLEC